MISADITLNPHFSQDFYRILKLQEKYGHSNRIARSVRSKQVKKKNGAHIFKIGADGLVHEIEAMGFGAPYNAPTGWE